MSPFSFSHMSRSIKWLLGANALCFILQLVFPGALESFLALTPARVVGGLELWRLATYMFLHGGFFHLLFNMFSLWMFGRELENAWGTKEFLKFYFFCGLGAAVANTAVEPFSTASILGASGAIYGLLVAFAIVYPGAVIYLYGIIPMQSKHFVMLMAAIEFFASFDGLASGIARLAHLGGMAAGFLYLKSYEFRSFWTRLTHRFLDSVVVRKPPEKKREKVKKENLAKEVDRILEKVLVHGADSLTDEEREIMRRYSSMKH